MHELIQTKVAPPVWLGNQIRRDVLLARLDAALDRRLVILHAPAGYGKTSLLAQWRRRFADTSVQVAWLTLDRDDDDPVRLARYLALAIDGDTPPDGDALPANLPPRAALSAIVNRLAGRPHPIVLILDDLHRADNAGVSDFLTSLIRLAPAHCRFVIASRDRPQLDQSVLAAADQLVELSAEDLKFDARETEALLGELVLDGKDLSDLAGRTEGWPIALQLAALSLRRGIGPRELVEHFTGTTADFARYLSEQVLTTLPRETQEIVMRTSLVERLTGEAIDLLCDRQDGGLVLERLEQQGVVLTPLTLDRSAYRYHPLFAEYLRERLARRDAGEYRALQRRAAVWFADHGRLPTAIDHAIAAADEALLADLLERAGGWRLIQQGMQAVAERGLAHLPAALVETRPRLALARVYLQIKHGAMASARRDFERIAAAESAPDLQTEIRVVADVLSEYENLPATLEDLLAREQLLRSLPSDDHLTLGNFSESIGSKYYENGWLERALEPMLTARDHYQAMDALYSDLFTRFHEARIKRAQGRFKESAAVLATAHRLIDEGFGARSDLAANCAAFEAELLYERNCPAEASALLDWALPHMEQSDGWVEVYAAAFFTAARIAAAAGADDQAKALLARAARVAHRRRYRQLELLVPLAELELAIQHGASPVPARALAEAIGLDALADEMARESPVYRPVATAAALCRVKLRLLAGEIDAALGELEAMRRWAELHGAGRLLIDLGLLRAHALHAAGDAAAAQAVFDETVGTAMFQDIVRPFVDAGRFVQPLVEARLAATPKLDRFRGLFLRNLARAFSGRDAATTAPDRLNDAEAAILGHLGFGYSNKEIARLIGQSPDTVKYRLKSLFRKLGVTKRRDAVRVSRERGLVGGDAPA